MPPKVVVTNWIHSQAADLLRSHCTLMTNPTREPWSREEIIGNARDATGLMMFMPDRVDDAFLAQCPRLRIIACALKGYDNFDVEACTRRGVWLTVVPDLLTVPAAELTIGLLISLARNVTAGDGFIRSGEFNGWRPRLYGTGLAGSTVGVLGMGKIGTAIVERLRDFNCRALNYHDKRRLEKEGERVLGLRYVSLEELLSRSDFLIVAIPLTDETKHQIGAEALSAMKPGSYLLNIARGSVVDEQAVAEALARRHLAGYAADVFETEDWARADRPREIPQRLLDQPGKTLFTPHLGSAVHQVRTEIEIAAARAIIQVLHGQSPDGAVNRPATASD
ncbi:MAG: phosphonate dehydrogenase [Acidiferrobacterales bacterium]